MTERINKIFEDGKIPTPFKFSRLHLLNKLKTGLPILDDLRPIMISSPTIKLVEGIALMELKLKLEPKIAEPQVGFLPELGTQVHILRLIGKIIDIQNEQKSNPRNWSTLLVDFKAAFDRIDHLIVLRKLEETNVSSRTLNIIKLLYSSCHFTLPSSKPNKINCGVVQGSLILPLLFNWYGNDLILELEKKFSHQHTFAYAGDISLLCLGKNEIRDAIMLIEKWCSHNGLFNKKKCGILKITKRESINPGRDIEGVSYVNEYK